MFGCSDLLINFGIYDLKIVNNCNLNDNSSSILGFNYQLPKGIIENSEDAKSYLAGSHVFKILEIEVYLV